MSAPEKQRAPSYPWYPRDFDMDEEVKLMTYEEEGIYRRLLDHQWFHGGIPADVDLIARLVPKIPAAKFKRAWTAMAAKFTSQDGRLVNRKLERVRADIDGFRERQRNAGRISAETRRQRHGSAQPNARPNQTPNTVRTDTATPPEVASASASANDDVKNTSSSPTPPNDRRTGAAERRTDPNARSKWPIFRGQRLVVFDWQFEDIIGMLGPHAEAFGLDEWWQELDERCLRHDLIPPKRDNGEWLREQTLAEAQRRGLRLRIAKADAPAATAAGRARPTEDDAAEVLAMLKGGQ